MFIKRTLVDGHIWGVGTKARMRIEKANKLIEEKRVIEYTGQWPPPKKKTKINLKDLR